MNKFKIFIILAMVWPLSACAEEAEIVRKKILLQSPAGASTSIMVEIADTDAARTQGFMGREHIPTGTGMLFLWPKKYLISMWMKDTPHPLDILFIDENTVVKIVLNTTPFSEESLHSQQPVNKILELPAGDVDKFKIKVGWNLSH